MTEIRYKIKTPPAFLPVDVNRLKRNLRIDADDHTLDYYLEEILHSSVDFVQTSVGRQLARATYLGYLDSFPDEDEIEITLGPVDSIVSIKYYDINNVQQIMNQADYMLDNIELTAKLRFLKTFGTYDRYNGVEIEFKNGWASAEEIPAELKDAIILVATERFLNPENEAQISGGSLRMNAADRILKKYKVQRF